MARKFLSIKGKCSMPLPAKATFKQNNLTKDGVKFFDYWQDLSPELAPMARVRVYRMKPPIDLTKIGERVKSVKIWEGPIPFKADDYEKEFYEASWAGGGDYRCAIEEIGLSGVICEVFFSLPDWDTYPPKVADASLMVESNAGQEYVKWRARRNDPVIGAEPEKTQQQENDDFMELGKSASPAATLVDGFVQMATSQVSEAKQEAREAREIARQPDSSMSTVAATEAIKLMGDTTRELVKSSGTQYDPVSLLKGLTEMMPKPVPPPDPTPTFQLIIGMMEKSNAQIALMQSQQIDRLSSELTAIRNVQAAPTNGHTKTFDEELDSFSRKAEALGYKRGGDNGVPAESKDDMVKLIVQNMPMINAAIAGIAQILIPIFRGPHPVPNPAPTMPQQPAVMTQPQPAAPDPNSREARELAFMQDFEKPFLAHLLSPEFDGFTLALFFLTDRRGGSMPTPEGRVKYNEIKTHLGKQPDGSLLLDRMIRNYPPIWNKAQSDQPAYAKFLAEFFSYDEVQTA